MTTEIRSFLRLKQVKVAIGLSRSWIHEAVKRGDFPPPISIGARAVAWDAEAIAKWQASRQSQSSGNKFSPNNKVAANNPHARPVGVSGGEHQHLHAAKMSRRSIRGAK